MKKSLIVLCIFLIPAAFVQAQNEEVFRHPLSAQNTSAFRATCASLAGHQIIRGRFEQEKILSRLNRSLKSSGSFIIAVGSGMVWDTLSPFPSTLVLGADYLIQSRPGGQKTVLSAQGNEVFLSMADVISAVFSGNARGLENNFNIYYHSVSGSWEMGLIPVDRAINSFAQRIIMKGDSVIKSIQITEQSGDSTIYIMSNHNFPEALNANERAVFALP
ncbi:MAG: outer membrane lipoprotein carrier protein LolA [Treponema sp.]|nr:outer membrane lipoprotein carrier protein LolA [Treponema sp.]